MIENGDGEKMSKPSKVLIKGSPRGAKSLLHNHLPLSFKGEGADSPWRGDKGGEVDKKSLQMSRE
jgi:hypothetical protein